ncbi:MAG: signal recognition particle protein [Simkaniaceae bacterium]|nr:signal recognition particle protein [Simkaniaceae bacterium]
MFGSLTDKFQNLFSSLSKNKKLTEDNISDAVRQVRMALLDADVNFKVTSRFVKRVKEKALGQEAVKSVSTTDQFIQIVHDELKVLMGGDEAKLDLKSNPAIIMLCGLQGSGKTTHAAKLALYLKGKNFMKNPMLVACDLARPAAIEQLKVLGEEVGAPVFTLPGEKRPTKVAKAALVEAEKRGHDLIIFDTAGRLHIDDSLMKELEEVKKAINPHEVLFVASAAIGQDAAKTADEFNKRIGITGSILTMLDGSARAGAAISIKEVTGMPLKFEGVGEKVKDLQLFNPHSMADRILGMGDVINLVKKAKETFSEGEDQDFKEKLKNASFTYEDYLKQMAGMRKMGSMKSIMKMLPGMNKLPDLDSTDGEFNKMEAMILSMTRRERQGLDELIPPRRRRIAAGSATTIDDVNKLVKGFKRLKQVLKDMPGFQKKMKNNKMFSKLMSGLK